MVELKPFRCSQCEYPHGRYSPCPQKEEWKPLPPPPLTSGDCEGPLPTLRGPGRPRKPEGSKASRKLNIALTEEDARALEAFAARHHLPPAAAARALIVLALAEQQRRAEREET